MKASRSLQARTLCLKLLLRINKVSTPSPAHQDKDDKTEVKEELS